MTTPSFKSHNGEDDREDLVFMLILQLHVAALSSGKWLADLLHIRNNSCELHLLDTRRLHPLHAGTVLNSLTLRKQPTDAVLRFTAEADCTPGPQQLRGFWKVDPTG